MSKFVRGLKLMGGSLKNIWKGSKTGKGLIIITALLMIGGCSGEESYTPEQYDELVSGYEQQIEDLEKEVNEQKGYVKNWKGKVNDLEAKTKDYLELDDNEKEIVDAKIVEVNQATEEQIAAEKAQKEAEEKAKKEEEERKKAEEEAARKAEEERKAQEEAERKAAEEEAKRQAEAQKYETGLTWEQIAREGKVGTLGKFEGKIIQVMNGSGFTQYRVAINGDYNTIMLIEVLDGISSETLLEDDYVYFKGMSMGQYTYTTVLGAEMTIPSFLVDEITR